jgi:hypothetical protein
MKMVLGERRLLMLLQYLPKKEEFRLVEFVVDVDVEFEQRSPL